MEITETIQRKTNTVNKKKKLKKADVGILDRILIGLYNMGNCKKTTIARNSRMSYDNCMMYLEYLVTIDFVVQTIDEDGSKMFSLTEHGIKICKRRWLGQFEIKNQTK